jgi:hypothetical protein
LKPGFGIRDSGFGIRDSGFGIRDESLQGRHPGESRDPFSIFRQEQKWIPASAGMTPRGRVAIDYFTI